MANSNTMSRLKLYVTKPHKVFVRYNDLCTGFSHMYTPLTRWIEWGGYKPPLMPYCFTCAYCYGRHSIAEWKYEDKAEA